MDLFMKIDPLTLIKESAQPLCLPGTGRKMLCYYPWGPVTEGRVERTLFLCIYMQ